MYNGGPISSHDDNGAFLAVLQSGYVIPKRVAEKLGGAGFMEALNEGRPPFDVKAWADMVHLDAWPLKVDVHNALGANDAPRFDPGG